MSTTTTDNSSKSATSTFTRDNWSKSAAEYRRIGQVMQKGGPLATLLANADAYLPFSQATNILDNGCGPAPVTAQIIEKYGADLPADCRLTAADYSSGMIDEVNKQRAEAADGSLWKRVRSVVQDATDLKDFDDGAQTHVLANMVYFMTPDPFKCLTESRRVLQDGGVLSLTSMERAQWLEAMDAYKQVRPDLEKPMIPAVWCDIDLLRKEIERAGFRDVKVVRAEMTIPTETYEKQFDMLWNMAVMQEMRRKFSEDEFNKVRELTIERLAEMCPTEPGTLKGFILVATARK